MRAATQLRQIHAGDGLGLRLRSPLDRGGCSDAASGTRSPGTGRESPGFLPFWLALIVVFVLIGSFLGSAFITVCVLRVARERGDLILLNLRGRLSLSPARAYPIASAGARQGLPTAIPCLSLSAEAAS